MAGASIPACPLMSAGNDITIICIQDKCAWYLPNVKKCAMYMMGHKSMLEMKDRADRKEEQ